MRDLRQDNKRVKNSGWKIEVKQDNKRAIVLVAGACTRA